MNKQKGFVLLMTLWVLAAMVLAIGFIASWAYQVQESVFTESRLSQWERDLRSTRSTLLYLGATNGLSYAGLRTGEGSRAMPENEFEPFSTDIFAVTGNELRLDGRRYQGFGDVVFALQDTGALRSINNQALFEQVHELLVFYGVDRAEASRLLAALSDYIDRDNVPSLDGVEREGYRRLGLLPPTNRLLVSPTQLINVAGWKSALGDRFEDFLADVSVLDGNRLNFNTLTPNGLAMLDELDDSTVEKIMSHRQAGHFRSVSDVNRITDVLIPTDALAMTMIPATNLRLMFGHAEYHRGYWVGVRFTPMSGSGPWQIDYNVTRGIVPEAENQEDARISAQDPKTPLFR